MTFGSAKETLFEAISKVDQKLANELVARALDAGINHFNTADLYTGGQSEEFLAKALGNSGRTSLFQRKSASGRVRRSLIKDYRASISRVGGGQPAAPGDRLYRRLSCSPDGSLYPCRRDGGSSGFPGESGKVRYIGFSNWPAWTAAKTVGLQRQ
jgi:diketogulonate reductase-like aldo/keto reductase